MKNISFELFPCNNIKDLSILINYLKNKKPSFISVTFGKIKNLKFVENLQKKFSVKIIPHLICDNIFNIINNIIYFIKIKIFTFLIITGDKNKNNSINYISLIRILFGYLIKIITGCYFENHKFSDNFKNEILFHYKKNKKGVNINISQFFYNFNIINYYIKVIKKTGINKNLILGIILKKEIKDILNFVNLCKIDIPLWLIKNYYEFNIELFFIKNLKKYKNLHFYTFNNISLVKNYFK
ncbi:methylenetetrahydrofolate reductase [Candidatus Carsonella ruddii]|uniref:Methylenetetrahydrofolate reductase n=1 Tax=Candidatus Carsonella ruddii PC isolate NHV TaxID=1202540 RepID=J3TEM4_CARRU|nr:methylenetetrahydrofolate reductase [Candidatus Carsonella ruddii]AFP84242.1 putative 5,10-methylenetetrahydrofolate reductase [Candidatus Carsonella ruddii PC isolate NHV]